MDKLPMDGYMPHPVLRFLDNQFGLFIFNALGIGKDMGNPWVSNSQPVPIPTSNPYP